MLNWIKPWIVAAGSSAIAWAMAKRGQSNRDRLREAKLELIEQQRTIDRLRAELGKERALRQEREDESRSEEGKITSARRETISSTPRGGSSVGGNPTTDEANNQS